MEVICEEDDYWPLPFYLRGFDRVGWRSEPGESSVAPVLVVSPKVARHFDGDERYFNTGTFQLRHGVFRSCLVEPDLWDLFLRRKPAGDAGVVTE